jgi:L-lactate dehydrogenase complex protein LldF
VYERTGGHAYGSTYPGPIGAILTPQLNDTRAAETLPYASSLCSACYEVCPVKIDIPRILVHLRGKVVRRRKETPAGRFAPEALAMAAMARLFRSPRWFEQAQRAAAVAQKLFLHGGVIDRLPGPLSGWTAMRDIAPVPRQSFRAWWKDRGRS